MQHLDLMRRLTMNRVLMTQSGFVTIVPIAPAVMAAAIWVNGSSCPRRLPTLIFTLS